MSQIKGLLWCIFDSGRGDDAVSRVCEDLAPEGGYYSKDPPERGVKVGMELWGVLVYLGARTWTVGSLWLGRVFTLRQRR